MKKTFLTAALALVCAAAATAQDRAATMKSPEERAQRHAKMMGEKLNLSNDQKAKIERIDLQTSREMQAPMDASHQNREKMHAVQIQREEQYKQVLNQQQFADFQKMKEEHKMRREHRMKDMQKGERRMMPRPADEATPVEPVR